MYTSIAIATFLIVVACVVTYFVRRRPIVTTDEEDPIVADINEQMRLSRTTPSDAVRDGHLKLVAYDQHEAVIPT